MAPPLSHAVRSVVTSLVVAVMACTANAEAQTLESRGSAVRVTGASVRVATGTPSLGAGYLTLTNSGSTRVVIRAFECQNVRSVRLHLSTAQGGVMRMVPLDSIEIAPHGSVSLRPGAAHLMLEGPRRQFRAGTLLTCTLHEADGVAVTWLAPVRAP